VRVLVVNLLCFYVWGLRPFFEWVLLDGHSLRNGVCWFVLVMIQRWRVEVDVLRVLWLEVISFELISLRGLHLIWNIFLSLKFTHIFIWLNFFNLNRPQRLQLTELAAHLWLWNFKIFLNWIESFFLNLLLLHGSLFKSHHASVLMVIVIILLGIENVLRSRDRLWTRVLNLNAWFLALQLHLS
jgi:hypothetical protein